MINSNKPLTTGEISTYCGVSRMGVLRWIKEGKLKAYRTPGGHFRVYPHNFETFLAKTDFPAPVATDNLQSKRILIVTPNSIVLGNLVRLLSAMNNIMELDVAMNEDVAVFKMINFQPMVVIFDGDSNILTFVEKIEKTKRSIEKKPALVLTKAVLTPSNVSRVADIFSPIILEPALPTERIDHISARFKRTIQQLVLD